MITPVIVAHFIRGQAAEILFLLCSLVCAGRTFAAEDYKLRFPMAGNLGGEIGAALNEPGWYGSTAMTAVKIDKVTGSDGRPLVSFEPKTITTNPSTGAPLPVAVNYTSQVTMDLKQTQTQASLVMGYLTEPHYAGGRLIATFTLPYMLRQDRGVRLTGPVPTATGPSALVNGVVQSSLNSSYEAGLAARASDATGVVQGWGDAEISASWVYREADTLLVTGLTLALPTGKYSPLGNTPNIGFGNFYTLRTGLAVSYNATPDWRLGAKVSLGFNTRNKDTDVRSGNFAGVDLAALYRTSFGSVGPHLLYVQQYQQDSIDKYGKFNGTSAGALFTALIKPLDASINVSYMKTLTAANALSGSFLRVRVSKAF
jgi:hypothetical protein